MHQFIIKHKRFILRPFSPKKTQYKFFHKKSFGSILSFYADVTLYKISQKYHILIFDKTWKPHFAPIFFSRKT